jgi:hypothetical protein
MKHMLREWESQAISLDTDHVHGRGVQAQAFRVAIKRPMRPQCTKTPKSAQLKPKKSQYSSAYHTIFYSSRYFT